MSFNFKKEETKKNYTRAKGMSKYKNITRRQYKKYNKRPNSNMSYKNIIK
jgi:hypothetical protein